MQRYSGLAFPSNIIINSFGGQFDVIFKLLHNSTNLSHNSPFTNSKKINFTQYSSGTSCDWLCVLCWHFQQIIAVTLAAPLTNVLPNQDRHHVMDIIQIQLCSTDFLSSVKILPCPNDTASPCCQIPDFLRSSYFPWSQLDAHSIQGGDN